MYVYMDLKLHFIQPKLYSIIYVKIQVNVNNNNKITYIKRHLSVNWKTLKMRAFSNF